jgi:hypothetical protein
MPAAGGRVVDIVCEAVTVLDKKLAQFDVVNEPSGAGELVPCVGPVGGPVPADRLGLGGLDRAGREPGLALGDMGPDEGGCLLPLAVVEDWLDRSWDWRQATGEFVPGFRVEAPFLHGVAAVAVVNETGRVVELGGEAGQGRDEVLCSVVAEPPGQVGRE